MRFIAALNNALGVLVLIFGSAGVVFAGGYYETIALREAAYYAQIQLVATQPIESLTMISTRDL